MSRNDYRTEIMREQNWRDSREQSRVAHLKSINDYITLSRCVIQILLPPRFHLRFIVRHRWNIQTKLDPQL